MLQLILQLGQTLDDGFALHNFPLIFTCPYDLVHIIDSSCLGTPMNAAATV